MQSEQDVGDQLSQVENRGGRDARLLRRLGRKEPGVFASTTNQHHPENLPIQKLNHSGCNNVTIAIWNRSSLQLEHFFTGHADRVNAIFVSADELRTVSESDDKVVPHMGRGHRSATVRTAHRAHRLGDCKRDVTEYRGGSEKSQIR